MNQDYTPLQNAIVVEPQYNETPHQPPVYNDMNPYQNSFIQPQQYNQKKSSGLESKVKLIYRLGFCLYIPFFIVACLFKHSDNDETQNYRKRAKRWAKIYSIILAIVIVIILVVVGVAFLSIDLENHDIDDVIFED